MKEQHKIIVPLGDTLRHKSLSNLIPPQDQGEFIQRANDEHFIFIDHKVLRKYLNSDVILLHKWKHMANPIILALINKTFIVDKEYFLDVEARTFRNLSFDFSPSMEQDEITKLSKKNFTELVELNRNKKTAYCFVTGPSFDEYKRFNYERSSFKIISSTIVKNREFLDFITSPDAIAFGDPIFHFGPSKYADAFRKDMVDVIKKYNCFMLIPKKAASLLLCHYPALRKKVIAIGMGRSMNFPTPENFWLKSGANVLTTFMLPMASSLSDNIKILGADGRKESDRYFWTHSTGAQFTGLMKTAFETHPSFFRDMNYREYYQAHCAYLRQLIEYGENQGKHYYSLTRSYIPALQERFVGNL